MSALQQPHSIVVSRKLASRYWNDLQVLGKSIELNHEQYTVTGLLDDLPQNTDRPLSALVSFNEPPGTSWTAMQCVTYVLLQQGVDTADLLGRLNVLTKEKTEDFLRNAGGLASLKLEMQPLTHLHFIQGIAFDTLKGSMVNVITLIIVGGTLLLIAIFNFINLTILKTLRRSREVGVRKIIGARNRQLALQLLVESLIILAIAIILSMALVELLEFIFSSVLTKRVQLTQWRDILVITGLLSGMSLLIILAMMIPAFYLAATKAATTVKGAVHKSSKGIQLRRMVVGGQFALCSILLISLFVSSRQMNFIKTTDLGFDLHRVVVIDVPQDFSALKNLRAYRDRIEQEPSVATVSFGLWSEPGKEPGNSPFAYTDDQGRQQKIIVEHIAADRNYLDLLDATLISGSGFKDLSLKGVSNHVIVNEALVRQAGWEDPIGKKVILHHWGPFEREVVGVVSDFHFNSLHSPITPMVIYCVDSHPDIPPRKIYVRINDITGLHALTNAWNEIIPDYVFQYRFLDESYDQQYKNDQRVQQLIAYLTLLTLFVAVLGLYSTAAYQLDLRTREIGVRKVLGAGLYHLIRLLAREFILLVLVSCALSIPVAWWLSQQWLLSFAYRTVLPWWIFVSPVVLIVTASFFSVLIKIAGSMKINAAEVLKSE